MGALGTDDDHRAVVRGLADDGEKGIRVSGNVAGTKGFDDDSLQPLRHNGIKQIELNAGKHLDDADGNVLHRLEGKFALAWRQQRCAIIANCNARLRQSGIVGRFKGNQVVR